MTPLIKFAEKFVSFDNRADGRSTTMTEGRWRGGEVMGRDEKFAQDCAQEAWDGGMVAEARKKKRRSDEIKEKGNISYLVEEYFRKYIEIFDYYYLLLKMC